MSRVAITTPEEMALREDVAGRAGDNPTLMRFVRRELQQRVYEAVEDDFFEPDEAEELIEASVASVAMLPAFWVRYKMLCDLPDDAFGNA